MSREPETNASRGDSEAKPFPKAAQLHRGERRTARKRATRAEWAAIVAAKIGPCRVCCDPGANGSQWGKIQLHHLIPRSQGGDDCVDNIVPLCLRCHEAVTQSRRLWMGGLFVPARELLAGALTDAEYSHVIDRLGEGALERLYGVGRP